MEASYRIDADRKTGFLNVTLTGFFSIDDTHAMRRDLRAAIEGLGLAAGAHLSLYDISACKIQSQDVVAALRSMSDSKPIVASRLAVVTGNSLMRMQLNRILVGRNCQFFASREPAKAWLCAKQDGLSGSRSGYIADAGDTQSRKGAYR